MSAFVYGEDRDKKQGYWQQWAEKSPCYEGQHPSYFLEGFQRQPRKIQFAQSQENLKAPNSQISGNTEFKPSSWWRFTSTTEISTDSTEQIRKRKRKTTDWLTKYGSLDWFAFRESLKLYLSLTLQFILHAAYSFEPGAHTRFLAHLTLYFSVILKTLLLTNLSYFYET